MTYEQGNLLIVWHDSNLTGINILDEEHRGIVSIINALHYSLFVRKNDALLHSIVEMIMGYSKIHFETEMELLKDSDYPRRLEHHGLHEQLIAESDRIFQECLHGSGDSNSYLKFLKDWWLVHINREDKAYSGHLLEYFRSGQRVIIKRG